MAGSLGVDGYNPSAIQYDKDDGADAPVEKVSAIPKKTKTVATGKRTRRNAISEITFT